MLTFNDLDLSDEVARAIKELGFETPSPIQQQALPILMDEATDFIGLAATGTGKTAAFSIPLLEQLDDSMKGTTQCLVLCPTRELALQVTGQINLLGKYLDHKALPVYGGAEYNSQIRGLREGTSIVVGTPGRLIDHLNRGNLDIENVSTVILDEADEMISMGFKEDLETILQAANQDTNIWLFSATMSSQVKRVSQKYLQNPEQVQVNRQEMLSTTVEQIYYPSRESDKADILCKVIENADDFYGLIFCQTKSLVSDLTSFLVGRGYKVDCLHGDKDQRSREKTMQAFRDKRVTMLVCTDVASRGLDVKDVSHVINYSLPRELDNYVHRIGRTARSGKAGIAISLVTPTHRRLIRDIERMTKSKMKEGQVPSRREIGAKKVARLLGQFTEQKFHARASALLDDEWIQAIEEMPKEEVIGRFLNMLSPEIFSDREKIKAVLGPHAGADGSGRKRRSDRPLKRGRREGGRPERARKRHRGQSASGQSKSSGPPNRNSKSRSRKRGKAGSSRANA